MTKSIQDIQIPKAHDGVANKLKLLDLTPLRLLFLPLYSPDFGRPSFPPEDMMRTFIAMTLCGISSLMAISKTSLASMQSYLDSCLVKFLLLDACMT